MSADLEVRDKLAIAELFARYSHSVDHAETDTWVALFTADGLFEIVGVTRFQGAAELRAMPAMLAENGKGAWRHQITDIVSAAGPDGATAQAYGLITDWGGGGKAIAFAEYTAQLRRTESGWRFARLAARMAADQAR
jgi:ketosteroid isomerase-like protein